MGTRRKDPQDVVFLIDIAHSLLRRLSNKSRLEMTTGRITTLISADASYLVSVLAAPGAQYGVNPMSTPLLSLVLRQLWS